jgi:hypothetical protein
MSIEECILLGHWVNLTVFASRTHFETTPTETTSADQRAASRRSWTKGDVIASVLLLVFIVLAYVYFPG